MKGGIGIGHQNWHCKHCHENIFNTYAHQVWSVYIYRIGGLSFFYMLNNIEIIININRYNLLYGTFRRLDKIPLMYLVPCVFISQILIIIPAILSREIVYEKEIDKYISQYSEFGRSAFHQLYAPAFIGTFYFIEVLCLIFLHTKNLIKYYELIKFVRTRSNKKIKKSEKGFTRMILITTFIFIFISFLIFFLDVVSRIYYRQEIYYDPVINIFGAVTYFALSLNYLLDPFIYLLVDINLRKIITNELD